VSVTILYTFTFPYSMLSVIDELLTYIIKLARSYHWILPNIECDYGRVEIFDSLKKELNEYQSIIHMIER
jgi:hypothetical protein